MWTDVVLFATYFDGYNSALANGKNKLDNAAF